jgi:hypothetical protein
MGSGMEMVFTCSTDAEGTGDKPRVAEAQNIHMRENG